MIVDGFSIFCLVGREDVVERPVLADDHMLDRAGCHGTLATVNAAGVLPRGKSLPGDYFFRALVMGGHETVGAAPGGPFAGSTPL